MYDITISPNTFTDLVLARDLAGDKIGTEDDDRGAYTVSHDLLQEIIDAAKLLYNNRVLVYLEHDQQAIEFCTQLQLAADGTSSEVHRLTVSRYVDKTARHFELEITGAGTYERRR